jgi:hypothetical protein
MQTCVDLVSDIVRANCYLIWYSHEDAAWIAIRKNRPGLSGSAATPEGALAALEETQHDQATALLEAVVGLQGLASINVGMVADLYLATCGPHEAFGPTAADAVIALWRGAAPVKG